MQPPSRIIIIAAIIIAFIVWRKYILSKNIKCKNQKLDNINKFPPSCTSQIFVILTGNDPVPSIIKIFQNAYLPQRIVIGISASVHNNIVHTYRQQLGSTDIDMSQNIKLFINRSNNLGYGIDRSNIINKLYDNQKYTLITTTNCRYIQKWDVLLIESLIHSFNMKCHIVTNFASLNANLVLYPKIVKIKKGRLPIFSYNNMEEPAITKTLHVDTKCIFGPSKFITPILCNPVPLINTATDAFLLHAQMWCSGYNICNTGTNVYTTVASDNTYYSTASTDIKLFEKALVTTIMKGIIPKRSGDVAIRFFSKFPNRRSLPGFLGFIGVSNKYVSGRARLGIVNDSDVMEIICKYGSKQKYEIFKQEISF
jgi:hypothetical protein